MDIAKLQQITIIKNIVYAKSQLNSGWQTKNNSKEARLKAGLATKQAAKLIGVEERTWQRWEEQTGRKTEIPFYCWGLFLLKVGQHSKFKLVEKNDHKESIK
ncbi:helix-turn-helix domain-containing protein [Nitrosomonas sp. Nm34]|uniref:helix-turn-helix domain-containing protein n=1 Tax=Nitrosomonas sp. Nm34 TaxID=1881055 RepID=UPI0008E56D78|nr:helix-turn-helix domain-containing protein [Nitrosomonas sp. Nm34]SFI83410.1 hypothetical protein SAMN05428978_10439 [Nitrosomonas sp. Nm34]